MVLGEDGIGNLGDNRLELSNFDSLRDNHDSQISKGEATKLKIQEYCICSWPLFY